MSTLLSACRIRASIAFTVTFTMSVWINQAQANNMYLLSLDKLKLGTNEVILGYEIDTWRIRVRAVCRLPIGWMVTAGRELSQAGHIEGKASGFMTNLGVKQFNILQDFVLIDSPPSDKEKYPEEPTTFSGKLTVGTLNAGRESTSRTIELQPTNITLKPAMQCPAPPDS